MDIVFFASSAFALKPLERLIASGQRILCVVTQPDRAKGRGLALASTPVKEIAQDYHLKIYQPEELNVKETIEFLKDLKAELFIVVAYGKIFCKELLEIPKLFSINLHASLLPKYRGAAPINWAIINGEKESGVSVIKMNERMDAGEIILQERIAVDILDTNLSLTEKLSDLGAQALLTSIDLILNKQYSLIPQDEKKATYAPLLKKEDGKIRWFMPAEKIYNLVRGCQVWPGAFSRINNKIVKIWKAKVNHEDFSAQPGTILRADENGILVKTGAGNLVVEELQIESAKKMRAADFLRGHKLKPQDKFHD